MTQSLQKSPSSFPLGPTERILWQGRPSAGLVVTPTHLFSLLRGLLALGLFLYVIARLNMGVSDYFDIQVIVIAIFFMAIPIDIVKSAYVRRISSYTLTNQRGIMQMDMPFFGQVIRSYPILADTVLDFARGRKKSSIFFGTVKRKAWDPRAKTARVGFERIADGDAVFALIGQRQRGEI